MLQKISIKEFRAVKEEGTAVAAAGVVISLVIGVLYTFGGYAFYLTMQSNIRHTDHKKFILLFPTMYLVTNLCIPLGNKLLTKNCFSGIVAVMIMLMGWCLILVSVTQNLAVISLILVGIVSPIVGLLYTVPFHCSSRYFPTYYNTLNGVFLAFQGFGAALFSLFLRVSANPYNLSLNDPFNKYPIAGGLRLVAFCLFISAIFVWIHLKYNKEINSKLLLEYEKAANQSVNELQVPNQTQHVPSVPNPRQVNRLNPTSEVPSLKRAVCSPSFMAITLISFVTMNGFLCISSYKEISQKISNGNDSDITYMACLGFVLFGSSRMVVRWLIVRAGFKLSFSLVALVQLLSFYLLYSQTLIPLAITLALLAQGSYIAWFNLLILRVFGYRHASKLIHILLLVFSLSNFVVHILNYNFPLPTVITISGVSFIISAIALVLLRQSVQWA